MLFLCASLCRLEIVPLIRTTTIAFPLHSRVATETSKFASGALEVYRSSNYDARKTN